MKRTRSLGFIVLLGVVLAAGAFGFVRQRQETMTLRRELETARKDASEFARLRAENQRLRNGQISAADLEALRADHAALPRLRAELETLRKTTSPVTR